MKSGILTSRQVIEKVVDAMSKSYSGEFLVVRLNGFIHTDDKLALKDIWRQLGKEMDIDDDLMNRVCALSNRTPL